MFDMKEYHKKWQKENREKANFYSKKYYEKHKNKIKETQRKYRENNVEKIKEYRKKSHSKFLETHNWSKYCNERRRIKVEKLREQGVINAWAVVNGKEPKYKENKDE